MSRARITDDERRRLPPGQYLTRKFPVLHVGDVPYDDAPTDWDLRVWGAVESPLTIDFAAFRALPTVTRTCDIHCVTTWSKLDTLWEGVPFSWVVDRCRPLATATHVVAHSDGGYTTNIALEVLRDDGVMLAYRFDGRELEPDHGRPLRLLVPKRYFWKSAKWLRGLEFLEADRRGYWEELGYSDTADPWKEERYGF